MAIPRVFSHAQRWTALQPIEKRARLEKGGEARLFRLIVQGQRPWAGSRLAQRRRQPLGLDAAHGLWHPPRPSENLLRMPSNYVVMLTGKPLYANAKTRGFMREFGRGKGGSNATKAFYESVLRMEACGVHLIQRINGVAVEYIGNLVQKAARVMNEERWAIVLNPDLIPYFAAGHYSRMDWNTRLSLPTDLARWLHGYLCSHQATLKQPHRINLARLRDLSGTTAEMKRFRFNTRKAMSELQSRKVVFSWRIIEDDVLEFVRHHKALPEAT